MSERYPGLTAFQLDIAGVFFSLPESTGFLLAGGGALIVQGIVPRPTDDLDFFTVRGTGDVSRAGNALTQACSGRCWEVEVLREGPEFRRLQIHGPERILVDLAVDSPPDGTPTVTIAGPTLSVADLAPRKMLALFGRAEPRDFVDVYALCHRFDQGQLIGLAENADPGFDRSTFATMLRAHARLDDQDFPDIGVAVDTTRQFFDSWAAELDSS